MSTQRDSSLAEMTKHSQAARAVMRRAKNEGRPLNPDEESMVDAHVAQVQAHQATVERLDNDAARRDLVNSLGARSDIAGEPYVGSSLGAQFVASSEYTEWREQLKQGTNTRIDHSVEMLAAAGDPVLESGGTNAQGIAPTWLPNVATPNLTQWASMIQEVLPIQQLADGNTVQYPRVTTRNITNKNSTAESENKAGADFAFGVASKQLTKWTAFSGVSDELAQDAPAIARYIDQELLRMALQKEELGIAQALYTASVTFANGFTVSGSPTGYDMVLEAMVKVRLAGGTPTAILINPMDWGRLQAAKATTAGTYLGGGPYAPAASDSVWGGLVQVQTPVAPKGTPLVGDFVRGCTLYRKGGPRLESSNSHANYFQQDLVALRAEVRSALVVFDPALFCEVNLGS